MREDSRIGTSYHLQLSSIVFGVRECGYWRYPRHFDGWGMIRALSVTKSLSHYDFVHSGNILRSWQPFNGRNRRAVYSGMHKHSVEVARSHTVIYPLRIVYLAVKCLIYRQLRFVLLSDLYIRFDETTPWNVVPIVTLTRLL